MFGVACCVLLAFLGVVRCSCLLFVAVCCGCLLCVVCASWLAVVSCLLSLVCVLFVAVAFVLLFVVCWCVFAPLFCLLFGIGLLLSVDVCRAWVLFVVGRNCVLLVCC